jgi:hypothetical protein
MQEVEQTPGLQHGVATGAKLPVSVIIPVRNEAKNLPRCLRTLGEAGEVVVVDSQSTDATVEIAREFGAQVVQFHYQGGWPKKRQWAMDTLPLAYDWILLLDADEVLTPELACNTPHCRVKSEPNIRRSEWNAAAGVQKGQHNLCRETSC